MDYHTSKQQPQPHKRFCRICGNEYPVTAEFWHRNKNSKDGFQWRCKTCNCAIAQKYRDENPERERARSRKYREDHLEQTKTRNRLYQQEYTKRNPEKFQEWRDKNPEKYRQGKKREYLKNRSKYSERAKHWKKANPEKRNEARKRRRARILNAEGTYSTTEVRQLFLQQEGRCFHCDADISTGYHCDHWIPLSRGGSNWIENIRLLCPRCNLSKQDKLPHEWDKRYA